MGAEGNAGMGAHRKHPQGSSFAGVRHAAYWSARTPAQTGVWLLGSWWSVLERQAYVGWHHGLDMTLRRVPRVSRVGSTTCSAV